MRHNKKINHLGRQRGHRKSMLANLSSALIMHKRITTTEAKAKALRPVVEPIITVAKKDTTHARRMAFSALRDKEAVKELFAVVVPKVGDRPGGYTRILKLGFRQGDAADMCIIELVDFNETYSAGKTADKGKTTRRGRSKKSAAPAKEAVSEEVPVVSAAAEEIPVIE